MARRRSRVQVAVLVFIVGAAAALWWQAVGHRGLPPAGGAVLVAGEAHAAVGGTGR